MLLTLLLLWNLGIYAAILIDDDCSIKNLQNGSTRYQSSVSLL